MWYCRRDRKIENVLYRYIKPGVKINDFPWFWVRKRRIPWLKILQQLVLLSWLRLKMHSRCRAIPKNVSSYRNYAFWNDNDFWNQLVTSYALSIEMRFMSRKSYVDSTKNIGRLCPFVSYLKCLTTGIACIANLDVIHLFVQSVRRNEDDRTHLLRLPIIETRHVQLLNTKCWRQCSVHHVYDC